MQQHPNTPQWVLITPEVAVQMLEKNSNNRPLNQRQVDRYARVMKEGLWREDNEVPINVDRDGNITNGQHRLWAIVVSGLSLHFWVMRSTATHDELFATYDTGQGRALSTLMALAYTDLSVSEKSALSTIARQTFLYDTAGGGSWSRVNASPDELIALGGKILESPEGQFAIEEGIKANKEFKRVMRWWGTAVYLIMRDSKQAYRLPEFLEPMYLNFGYWGPNDPRVKFFSFVSNSRAGNQTNRHARKMVATFIQIWNKWLAGEELRGAAGYKENQPFPKVN